MLTAHRITAITLDLNDGQQAVMVQDGEPWNGLRKFKCIAPASLKDHGVIATRNPEGSWMSEAFNTIFRLDDSETWAVLMTSPALIAKLKRGPEPSTPKAPTTTEPSPC